MCSGAEWLMALSQIKRLWRVQRLPSKAGAAMGFSSFAGLFCPAPWDVQNHQPGTTAPAHMHWASTRAPPTFAASLSFSRPSEASQLQDLTAWLHTLHFVGLPKALVIDHNHRNKVSGTRCSSRKQSFPPYSTILGPLPVLNINLFHFGSDLNFCQNPEMPVTSSTKRNT